MRTQSRDGVYLISILEKTHEIILMQLKGTEATAFNLSNAIYYDCFAELNESDRSRTWSCYAITGGHKFVFRIPWMQNIDDVRICILKQIVF